MSVEPDAENAEAAEPSSLADEPEPEPEVIAEDVRIADRAHPGYVRRAPRFGAFLFVAIFLAALIAGLATFVRDSFLTPDQLEGRALDAGGMFLLLFLILAAFFSLAAYGITAWLDRRSVNRMMAARATDPRTPAP